MQESRAQRDISVSKQRPTQSRSVGPSISDAVGAYRFPTDWRLARQASLWVRDGGAEDAGRWSGYPPIVPVSADMPARQPSAISGCEQSQQKSPLFDHLVGGRNKIGWKRKPKDAGSTKIDDEIELRDGEDGKIARVGATKDTIDVARS
jgi:hypothetical protein